MSSSIIMLFIPPGHWELVLIVVAILLLFGGKKIPEMMRGLGTGVKEFRKGIKDEQSSGKEIPENQDKDSKD